MSRRFLLMLSGFAYTFSGLAQTGKPALDARDLYLESVAQNALPAAKAGKGNVLEQNRDLKRSQPTASDVRNLGIRYNVLLSIGGNDLPQPVNPQRIFKTGDCITLELQTNRAGHLYILAEGPSREWVALFPSGTVSEETTFVPSGVRTQVPAKDCLEFTNPPGIERLFLILLQDPADVKELVRAYRLSSVVTPTAENGEALAKLQDQFASRDLRVRKVEQPEAPEERPFTTYAVAQGPRLFIEVKLRHE